MELNLWKNKDELKKYLDNLGVEYRYGCFEENNAETCHLLGDYLLSIDKERSKAAQIYKKNCDENKFGLSCDAYGRLAYRGQGMEAPNSQLALEYFMKGCDLDEPRSCYHGGQMLGINDSKLNKTIPPDVDKAIEMLGKACQSKKQPQACTLIHSFYLRGIHGRPADLPKAAKYAEIACEQDEAMACFNLSRMYHIGDGVKPDQEKSAYFRNRAKDISSGIKKTVESNENAQSDI